MHRCWPILLGALLHATAATAWEPPTPRWTRISAETTPAHIVHYATVDVDQAREMLTRADVALLHEHARGTDRGVDLIQEQGLSFGTVHGFARQERFRLRRGEDGRYGLWDAWRSDLGSPLRLDGPDRPIERIFGLPTSGVDGDIQATIPYDPIIIEMPGELFAIRRVALRVNDPDDPGRTGLTSQLVTGTSIPLQALLPAPRDSYRLIVRFDGPRTPLEPRIWFLPIDGDGHLDPSREGVLLRLEVSGTRVDPWSRELDQAMNAIAVRVHLGDRASLKRWVADLPEPDRSLYARPGRSEDPLLSGPRQRKAPYGAGIQVAAGAEGRLTVLEPFDREPSETRVTPHFSGVHVEAWLGRASLATGIDAGMMTAQLGLKTGSTRDTDSTTVGVELAVPVSVQGSEQRLGVSGIVRARRRTRTRLLQRVVEVGSDLRAGNMGFDYRGLAGLRVHTGRTTVLTPTAFVGFRYGLPIQRGEALFGLAIDGALNANVFKKPTPSAREDSARPRSADPVDRGSDPPEP